MANEVRFVPTQWGQRQTDFLMVLLIADAQRDLSDLSAAAKSFLHGNESLPPLGHDPTFQPASRLWNYDLIARQGEYYNESQVCAPTTHQLYTPCAVCCAALVLNWKQL